MRSVQRIFYQAGLNGDATNKLSIASRRRPPSTCRGRSVTLKPILRGKRRLGLKLFDPCTILLNNDLSAGVPGILEDLHEQYLLPPLRGHSRRAQKHAFQGL